MSVPFHQAAEGAGQDLVAVADAQQRPAVAFQEFEQTGLDLVVADHFLRPGNDQRRKFPGVGQRRPVAGILDSQFHAGGGRPAFSQSW